VGFEKNGDVLAHASVREKKPGEEFVPMYNMTFRVLKDGKVKWKTRNLDPSSSFPEDQHRFYMVDYESMAAYDKSTGKEVWKKNKKHEINDPRYGPCGDTRFEIGGEHKYKYVKFVGAFKDRLYLQGYCEGPLRKTKSGEELLCVDPGNPDKVLWRRDSWGSVFMGPIYVDENVIIHVSDEKRRGPPRMWPVPSIAVGAKSPSSMRK
jgi:hypothetical protein